MDEKLRILLCEDDENLGKAYYDGHQSEFMADEHVTAQYVVLSPESFKRPA